MASSLCKLHVRCRPRNPRSLLCTSTPRLPAVSTWLLKHHIHLPSVSSCSHTSPVHVHTRCNSTMTTQHHDLSTTSPTTTTSRLSTSHVGLLVTDFDDTCTVKDTIGLLMAAALHARHQAAPASTDLTLPERLTETYISRQRALMAQLLPPAPSTPTEPCAPPFERARLQAFLSQLSAFDTAMNTEALDQGAVAGLSPAEIRAAAAGVQIRPGCRELLRRCHAAGLPLHIISVNWSSQFVAQALDLGFELRTVTSHELKSAPAPTPEHHPPQAPALLIANQLELGADGRTTGRLHALVQGADDKGRAFNWLLQRHRQAAAAAAASSSGGQPTSSGGRLLSLYVGDSCSDLLPLLDADVGVVMGGSETLRRVARSFGIQLRPLAQAPRPRPHPPSAANGDQQQVHEQEHGAAPESPVLYLASSWGEVSEFMFGGGGAAAASSPEREGEARAVHQGRGHEHEQEGAAATPSSHSTGPSTSSSSSTSPGPPPFVPRVLVVAGSDSGGGAGIQADLKAIMACGAYGSSAISALTAQNTHGVHGVHVTPLDFLEAQMDAVLADIGADAVKTGMLPSAAAVRVVAAKVRQYQVRNLVVDPVMISTSGHSLAEGGVPDAIIRFLAPLATLLTPNLPEASRLLGGLPIRSVGDMEEAARKLRELTGCRAVLLKGGHLHEGEEETVGVARGEMVDVLWDGHEMLHVCMPRLRTANTHGTGCSLASAIAAGLAKGLGLVPAVHEARAYLQLALARSAPLSIGTGVQRPFNHGFMLADWALAAGAGGVAGRLGGRELRRALRLYAVTDPGCNAKLGRSMEEAVRGAVEGGASIVQIREKEAEGREFLTAAAAAYKVCQAAGVPLIINDRIDVALATGPNVGVHVGQGDLPVEAARKLLGPTRMLGVSVRSVEQARAAILGGADYLGCGAVYPTSTKDSGVIGLEGLAAVCREAGEVPVVSIGGISAGNAAQTMHAGACGVAVVSAVFGAQDIVGAARELRAVVDAASTE